MYRTVKVKLYPNAEQELLFEKNVGCVRFVYNTYLAKRIEYYELTGRGVSYAQMCTQLPKLKERFDWLCEVDSTSLQQALKNLDTAYQRFFKLGCGFPKFKCKGERESFRCTMSLQYKEGRLKIGKHGLIKVRGSLDRLGAKINNITVTKEAGCWYAACLTEVADIEHIHQFKCCGIDVGVKQPLTVVYETESGIKDRVLGKVFSKRLRRQEHRRKHYQQVLARKQKGSANRNKAKLKVAKAYAKERNIRNAWIEKTSYQLAKRFEVIVFEDLKLSNMTRSAKGDAEKHGKNVKAKSGLNRELLRLGLGRLMTRTQQKASERQGRVVYVNPRFTSQTCPQCGCVDKKSRISQAEFVCTGCGHTDNADRNAALNILNKAA